MRKSLTIAPAAVLILGLAACTNTPMPNAGNPAGTQAAAPSPGSGSQMPQSPNSIPANTAVSAPRTPATGNVSTTVVR